MFDWLLFWRYSHTLERSNVPALWHSGDVYQSISPCGDTIRDRIRPRFCFECLKMHLNHLYKSICYIWAAIWLYQEVSLSTCGFAPFNCCDHAVLAHPCRSDMWSLWSNCRIVMIVMKSVNLHNILHVWHVFALLCSLLLYVCGNLDFCVISDCHLIWYSCVLFRVLLQVQREAEEIYKMGWASTSNNIILYNIYIFL